MNAIADAPNVAAGNCWLIIFLWAVFPFLRRSEPQWSMAATPYEVGRAGTLSFIFKVSGN